MADKDKSINGAEKAAILLLSLDEDVASEVMKHMGPTEIQKISAEMTKVEELPKERLETVAGEFNKEIGTVISVGGSEYVKNVLTKALGQDKADAIIDRVVEGVEGGGLEALRWMDPKVVGDMIKDEHPQTIAVIISHLEPEHASSVLACLNARLRTDVLLRVATMESISHEAMKELEETIKQQLSGGVAMHNKSLGGVKIAAEILNQMDSTSEGEIISDIEKVNGELAAKIQEQMFVFADLIKADDRGIQELLKEVSSDQLAVALKVADDALKEKIFKNMSERARDMLKEDIDTRGPMKLSEVEAVQQEIIKTARGLEEEGKLVIEGKGGEETLV